MTAIIEQLPGGLTVVKATLGEWKNAGKYLWERASDDRVFQIAYQSPTEAEITAHAINTAPLNNPAKEGVAA
ncbi:MAG: hypothetical protein HQL45_15685 [Alphaproteobacteria bacterium]|nr:hypothetical protein [Alphaproteobacteria bacterium]